jgi:glycosyltransferase involved in cell wall biosynthesis
MTTYNGSKYLAEQFDSIVAQSNKNWSLYVRDDSSSDNTAEIISQYCRKYNNIVSISDNKGRLGCCRNFNELLENVESKYYMFCDQDDVWLPNKIDVTFDRMSQNEKNNFGKPVIVFTDLKVVDSKLNDIADSFWAYTKVDPNILNNFDYIGAYNVVTGCTLMINYQAYSIIMPIPTEALMHDSWIALKVSAENGIIDVVNNATVLYRQHDCNVFGAKNVEHMEYIKTKLFSLKSVMENNRRKLKVMRVIKPVSLFRYMYFKLQYFIRR